MNRETKQSSFVNIGLSSLMVVFLVLCLTTFSILALSGAKSDYTLSRKLADHRTSYYRATTKAEHILKQIDDILAETYEQNGAKDYKGAAAEKLQEQKFEDIEIKTEMNRKTEGMIFYTIPVEKGQALEVKLRITEPSEEDTFYAIQSWHVVSDSHWESDEKLQLVDVE